MERFQKILAHEVFLDHLRTLSELERERIYCRHDLAHLLDVCRIAYIRVLEEELPYTKDVIYAAGLLHDLGRVEEYRGVMPHDEASAVIAERIMADCGYEAAEIALVTDAIRAHRCVGAEAFSGLMHEADKASRNCFWCEAREGCKWPEEKKNRSVKR